MAGTELRGRREWRVTGAISSGPSRPLCGLFFPVSDTGRILSRGGMKPDLGFQRLPLVAM